MVVVVVLLLLLLLLSVEKERCCATLTHDVLPQWLPAAPPATATATPARLLRTWQLSKRQLGSTQCCSHITLMPSSGTALL